MGLRFKCKKINLYNAGGKDSWISLKCSSKENSIKFQKLLKKKMDQSTYIKTLELLHSESTKSKVKSEKLKIYFCSLNTES